MYAMFDVRSARALPAAFTVGSSLHAACAAAIPRRLTVCMWPLFLCLPFDSAGRGDVQPAAELGHVQRHRHAVHVSGALRARALPATFTLGFSLHAACATAAPCSPASRPAWRPSSYASLLTRQSAAAFNQLLSLDTSSVTTMQYMFTVRSARALPDAFAVGPSLHAACAAAAPPRPPASGPACGPSP